MKYLIDTVYLLAALGYSPVLLYRILRHNRYRVGWDNRFGKINRKKPQKKCIWIHAVSVGEVNATRTIVDELTKKFPDFEILITTTTDTGFARANTLYGDKFAVCFFPLDFSWIMRHAFSVIDPAVCVLMELEVWPNFAEIAAERNIPIVVANARVTERSMRRYSKVKPFAKKMFANITCILAQTKQYAERFEQLGCAKEKITVTGSLKYDTAQVVDKVDGADILAAELNIGNDRLWVAGGTGNDEEAVIIDVYKKLCQKPEFDDVRLAIVPRKPERFDEVAGLISSRGFDLIRYSELKNNQQLKTQDSKLKTVVLGDTMGDLRKFYSLATIIFVGRSLVPMGGSDMIEAAALGKCTIFGPHAFNFRQTVDALLADEGAFMVKDGEELFDSLNKCLNDNAYAAQIAANGRNVILKNQGATAKTILKIEQCLRNNSSV